MIQLKHLERFYLPEGKVLLRRNASSIDQPEGEAANAIPTRVLSPNEKGLIADCETQVATDEPQLSVTDYR